MKKRANHLKFVVALAFVFMLIFGGLSPIQAQTSNLPSEITFATAREGTVSYVLAVGKSKIITKYTPMKCIVQPIGFLMQWGPSMEKGDVQISHQSSSGSYAYHYGALWWNKKPSHKWLQQLTSGSALKYAFHVRSDSDIHTVKDLEGKKFYCYFPAVPAMMTFVKRIFEFYKVDSEKVKQLIITNFGESVQEVIDGRADCVITTVGAGFPKIQRAGGCRILPISKEAAEYENKMNPFHSYTIAPAGYLGIPKDTLLMTDPQILLTHKDVPEAVTYTVLKALYDHHDELKGMHADARDWTLEMAPKAKAIPYHSGAIKFLKEKGLWTPDHERFQKEALAKDLKK